MAGKVFLLDFVTAETLPAMAQALISLLVDLQVRSTKLVPAWCQMRTAAHLHLVCSCACCVAGAKNIHTGTVKMQQDVLVSCGRSATSSFAEVHTLSLSLSLSLALFAPFSIFVCDLPGAQGWV